MGGDSQPAKIAKYLLKGYCLLNEYCPNGQNVPLVRSREGVLLCCCDDPTCPYKEKVAASPRPAAPAPSPSPPAALESSPPPSSASPRGGGGGAAAEKAPAASFQPLARTSARSTSAAGGAEPCAAAAAELTLRDPGFQFSCTRLAAPSRGSRRARLLGGSFSVKVRVGTDGQGLDTSGLREVVGEACQRLHERVLVPEQSRGVQVSRAAGQVMFACEDGARFEFPEMDCLALPTAGASLEELAAVLLESAMSSEVAAEWRGAGRVHWMEISVAEGSSLEATVRRNCA